MTDTHNPVDDYLARLSHHLTVDAATRAMILEEARAHLAEAIAQRVDIGAEQSVAVTQALQSFGSVAQVAARYNAVHPIAWDARRFTIGILWGIGLSWLIWTTTTFPFLVQQSVQRYAISPSNGNFASPSALLFAATPLSFGLMNMISFYGYWVVLPLLALFGVVPLLWGWRAQRGWQPGLAFGLGVIVGFPWLLPGIFVYWGNAVATMMLIVTCIWLLCPYAMLMSWLGHRAARARSHRASSHALQSHRVAHAGRYRSMLPYVAFGVTLIALVAINVWSWQRDMQFLSPSVAQQLSSAEATLSFPLRLPSFIPPQFTLQQVTVLTTSETYAQCEYCSVILVYQKRNGDSLYLDEWRYPPNAPASPPELVPPTSGYAVQQVTGGEIDSVWWLGIDRKAIYTIVVTWMHNGVNFRLVSECSSPSTFSVDQLKQIASSL